MSATQQQTMGSAAIQREFWAPKARDWAALQEHTAKPVYEAILGTLRLAPGMRLLDVGCGAGLFCAMAWQSGLQITGLDATQALLDIAQERVPQGEFRIGDLEVLPYDDQQFDTVTGLNAFQYAANPLRALSEARRVVRKGAPVVVQIWGREEDCQAAAYIKALGSVQPPPAPGTPGPFALSQDGALEALVKEAGLTPLQMHDIACPFVYSDLTTALQALLAAGPAIKAIRAAGEGHVRAVVTEALAPFKTPADGYRLENTFRYIIATT